MNPAFMTVFVLVDLAALAAIVTFVLVRRRRAVEPSPVAANVLDVRKLAVVGREIEARTVAYMQSRWNGDAATLAEAISSLLEALEADMRSRELPIGRPQLRAMVARLVESRGLAGPADVRAAMRHVA